MNLFLHSSLMFIKFNLDIFNKDNKLPEKGKY